MSVKIISIILIGIIVSSCGTTQKKPKLKLNKYSYVGKDKVYGMLVRLSDGYQFTNITMTPSSSDPYVLLNDLSPAMDTSVKKYCPTSRNRRSECWPNKRMFRAATYEMRYGRTYSNVFDIENYNDAIIEAGQKLESNEFREKFINKFSSAESKFTSMKSRYNSDLYSKFADFNRINNDKLKNIRIKENIIDKLNVKKYFNKIKFSSAIYNSVSYEELPEFNLKLDGDESLVELDALINGQLESLTKGYQANLNKLKENNFVDLVRVDCSSISNEKYNLNIDCRNGLIYKNKRYSVDVNIHSLQLKKYLPYRVSSSDKRLGLSYKGEKVFFTNKTNKFLTVNALSVYYDGDIRTVKERNIELPPQSTSKSGIHISDIAPDNASTSHNIYKRSDLSKKYNFGFAVKYKVGDSSKSQTLYKVKKYSVKNIIADMIR